MKVNFIIPNISLNPAGGYKVMYQCANAFAGNGRGVYLHHMATIRSISHNIPLWLRWLRTNLFYRDSKPNGVHIDNRIKTNKIPFRESGCIRKVDFKFSTMWATVLEVAGLEDSIGKCMNFIQGYETWLGEKNMIRKSFRTNSFNIVMSKHLENIVRVQTNADVSLLPNPICVDFKELTPMNQRNLANVSMLYSVYKYKRIGYGFKTLDLAKKEISKLTVEMSGIFKKTKSLPNRINYHYIPDNLCKLYDSATIFVPSSINDGWNLPCIEAMKFGCALVCTDIAGYRAYAKEKDTALLAVSGSARSLDQRIVETIKNEKLRNDISVRGKKRLKNIQLKTLAIS